MDPAEVSRGAEQTDSSLIKQLHTSSFIQTGNPSALFFLWSLHLFARTAPPSLARLWSHFFLLLLFTNECQDNMCAVEEFLIIRMSSSVRLIFIPSVCLVFHVIDFSPFETDVWLYLGKQASSFNLILLTKRKNLTLLELYIYFCLNFYLFWLFDK